MALPEVKGLVNASRGKPLTVGRTGSIDGDNAVPFPWWKRVRIWRIVLAAVVAILVLWLLSRWVVIPLWLPTGEGQCNMRSALVLSPEAGIVEPCPIEQGKRISAGQPIALLRNSLVDDSLIRSLTTRQVELRAHVERLANERRQAKATLSRAQAGLESYRAALLESLDRASHEAQRLLEVLRVEQQAAQDDLEMLFRVRQYRPNGVAEQELRTAKARADTARLRAVQQSAGIDRVNAEIEAAGRGVFLQKEGPFYLQLQEQTVIRLAVIDLEREETDRRAAALEEELAAARRHVERFAEIAVNAPVSGPVIRRMVHRGPVPRHAPLFEIADEQDVFVEVAVHQTYLDRIEPGCRAVINVTGGPTLGGKVRLIRLFGLGEVEPSNVNRIPGRPDRVSVLIDPDDPAALVALPSRHCQVLILNREPGWLQRAASWVFALRLR